MSALVEVPTRDEEKESALLISVASRRTSLVHDATTNDDRVFCCEEEEEDPHTAPLREGGGVLGEGIIVVDIFFVRCFRLSFSSIK